MGCSLVVYSNTANFCGLILYLATFLNLLIISNSFLWVLKDFLCIRSCHLWIGMVLFFFSNLNAVYFSCLILLLEFPGQWWVEVVKVNILVLFLIIRGRLSLLSMIWGFHQRPLSDYPCFWVFLSRKGVGFLILPFMQQLRWLCVFFSYSINVVHGID